MHVQRQRFGVPIFAGTWALTTEETVETARDVKALHAVIDVSATAASVK